MTARRSSLLALLPFVFLAGPQQASAHPHIWIDASAQVLLEAGAVRAIEVTWIFDEIYSFALLEDFDRNGDGRLDEEELQEVVAVSRENLPDFSFFTHLRIHGERRRVEEVEDFAASVEEERVVYRFTVPLEPPAPLDGSAFAFSLFDESYFVDVALAEGAVELAGDVPSGCEEQRQVDEEQPLYFGLFYPTYVSVSCPG